MAEITHYDAIILGWDRLGIPSRSRCQRKANAQR